MAFGDDTLFASASIDLFHILLQVECINKKGEWLIAAPLSC